MTTTTSASGAAQPHVGTKTPDDVARLAEQCRNWGRWGADDELGTLNYLSPQRTRRVANEVRTGDAFALGLELGPNGPQSGRNRRFNPIHLMTITGTDLAADGGPDASVSFADDIVIMPLQAGTQWDGLAHAFYEGKMWNGYDMRLVSSDGASKNSIVPAAGRLQGRGVLLDVARWKNLDVLDPGQPIRASDLDGTAAAFGVEIEEGDFVLVRTGWLGHWQPRNWTGWSGVVPGLTLDTLPWLHDHRVAAVATDTSSCEVLPSEVTGLLVPWHMVAIPNMGLSVGEIFVLDELAAACERTSCHSFLLVAAGLPITNAVATPINPIAIL